MFKVEDGVLKIRKVDLPDIKVNIMGDLQQSYRKYITSTYKEDMEFLVEELHNYQGMENVQLKVHLSELYQQTYNKSQVMQGKAFYVVYGQFSRDGEVTTRNDIELLRIPFMDDYGKINVNGASRVVLSVQRAAEDISYDLKKNMFNIAMPFANIRIFANKNSVKMAYGKYRYNISDIITYMLYEAGDDTKLCDVFRNTYLINAFKLNPNSINKYVHDAFKVQNPWIKKLTSVQYKLGTTREALNEALSLDRAIGETLSRDTLDYPAGTVVTSSMIRDFKRNRIHTIYVQSKELIAGYRLAEDAILIRTIPAGFPNCGLLRKKYPQYAEYATIPEDITPANNENAIVIGNNEILDKDEAEFLLAAGYQSIKVHPGNSQTVLEYSFEKEIISNQTARLGELTDDIPEGRSSDEWVYYYNNPNLNPVDHDYITAHDLMAITSIMGDIIVTGRTQLLNRDNSFLKKVLMVNEIFSECLRKAIKEFVKRYHANIAAGIDKPTATNYFFGLTNDWISIMNKERFLAPADTVNLSAEVSQVNHIVTLTASSAEILDEQRHLAVPFFGRICPYETPAGKKLGMVNTKALGAKVINGLLYTPYRKILATQNGIRISDRITWMSVKDELGHKFGDALSFVYDDKGNIMNTPILARIPNPDVSDEPFIFSTIKSYDLAEGFVPAYAEQFLSPTAALIPFAGSDDPVRISFGLSQIRQAIYLANSKKPHVRTPMYRDIFDYSDAEKFYAPEDGTVFSISNKEARIQSLDGTVSIIPMQGSGHYGNIDVTMNLIAHVGDKVKRNDVIAEAYKYPQPFVVRAPFSGTITDISDNKICIAKTSSPSSFINLEDVDYVTIDNGRVMGQSAIFLNIKVAVGDYVHKGQILADTCMSREGYYSPARSPLVGYISIGYNYEDGVCATERASVDYTSIIAHSIDKKVSKRNYKYPHIKSIQGYKYSGPGDPVGTIELREDLGDKPQYKMTVKASVKANGIPYECKTIEDDNVSRTYRYHLLGFNKLQVGDKMAGMHGDKGVVSYILPNSKAPQLRNGRVMDFIISPCGIPSRMNLGKMWHTHLGLVAEVLQVDIDTASFNGATDEDVAYLLQYAWTIANNTAIGDNITKQYDKDIFNNTAHRFTKLPNEFHEMVWKNIANVIDWRGAFNPDGTGDVYDPETDTFYENAVTFGYPTYLKLMQEADEKINARAGILEEQYARTTSQPQKSDDSAKGQRMAEMELMALVALGASNFIDEIINEKSDNIGKNINNTLKQLGINAGLPSYCCKSRSTENLLYLLEAMGVKLEVPVEIADVSLQTSRMKYKYDVKKLVHQYFQNQNNNTTNSNFELTDDFNDIRD